MRLRFHAFRLLALVFVCAAAYHAFAALKEGDAGRARHLIFVGIDLCLGALILRRPPGFVLVFAILCGQQLVSHGEAFVRSLRDGPVDWTSAGVLIFMPFVLVLLAIDARSRRASRRR